MLLGIIMLSFTVEYLIELSGDQPEIGRYELESIFNAYGEQLEIIRTLKEKFLLIRGNKYIGWLAISRAAYVRSAWRILHHIKSKDDLDFVKEIVNDYRYKIGYKVIDKKKRKNIEEMYQKIIDLIDREKLPGLPKTELQVLDFEDEYLIGEEIPTGRENIGYRNPKFRPYAPSATMETYLSRALVNFTGVKPGEIFLDPFAGSGSIAMEASSIGAYTVALDKSFKHLLGLKVNAMYYDLDVKIVLGDATKLPFNDKTFHAIATDPPYGRSAPVFKTSLEKIYDGFIREASRVLKTNSRLVFCSSSLFNATRFLDDSGFGLLKTFEMRVHKDLSRIIYVATLV